MSDPSQRFRSSQKRRDVRERAVCLLGGVCRICGYSRCPAAMDFHHVDPALKDFSISDRMDWEAVELELRKCALLCATCHREVHEGMHPTFLVQPDDGRGFDEDFGIQLELVR